MTTTDPPPGSADPVPAPPDGPESDTPPELPSRLDGAVRAAVTALGAFTAFSQISEYVRSGKLLDLTFGLVAALLCLIAVESLRRWLHRRESGEPDARPGRLVPATWLLVTATLLLAGSLTVVTVLTQSQARPVPPSTSAPDAELVPDPGPEPTPVEVVDDFADGRLNPDLWEPVSRPDVVSVVDGRLAFRVTPEVTPGTDLDVRLRPRLPDWPVEEISAVTTIQQGSGSPGGVNIVVRQQSGRESRLSLGPSPAGPSAEPWICRTLPCGTQYGDFDHPGQELFADGVSTPVRITHTGENLELVAGSARYSALSDTSPIVDVLLILYAGPNEQWTVTLDDFRLASGR